MLVISQHLINETIKSLATCGAGECECIAYWTGPNTETAKVDGWTHPTHQRAPHYYEVAHDWVPGFFIALAKQQRGVRAQLHTHQTYAFHSDTDNRYPLIAQAGFVSIVLPDYARGEALLERSWVGVLQSNGQWKRVPFASICEVIG